MMLIRSQDRKSLMPLGCLSIGEYGANKFCIENEVGDSSPFIGLYESESRCLEILDAIQKMFGNYMRVDVNNVPTKLFDYPKVYEIPEK